jgi:Na+-transporting methylmalonyl-CoA/oxaloacetate decarboxylase gamma subunit
MVTEESAIYGMNMGMHVFILFTFLTIFFFAFVSKLASNSIQNALDDIIDQQVEKILNEADKLEHWLKN